MTRFFVKALAALTFPMTAIAIAFTAPLQSSNDFSAKLEARLNSFRAA